MPSIIDYYNRNSIKVSRIVDQTFFRLLEDNTSIFSEIAPVVNYVDTMLLIMRMSRSKPTIASLVGDEQELPNSRSRIKISEETLSEARIGKQHVFTNNDFKAFKKLQEVLSRAGESELTSEFERVFMGIAADLAPAIIEKMTVLLMEVLTTGSCNYTDPVTKVKLTLTYDEVISSGIYQLMFTSAPLTADSAETSATANSLGLMESHATSYYQNFGTFPTRMYLRWNLLRDIANQLSTKRAVAAVRGYGVETDTAINAIYVEDQQVIDLIRSRTRGATVKLLDAQYSEESETGVVTEKYFLDDKRYLFAEPGNAERSFVPTPEKDFAPGIYVNAKDINDAPRVERIAGVGAGIPTIFDARKLACRRIKI
jgi:hypothetical protein